MTRGSVAATGTNSLLVHCSAKTAGSTALNIPASKQILREKCLHLCFEEY